MPIVRLSGTVAGPSDPNREMRARLLYSLFAGGWDIYNSNGDQRITLHNIERKILESDAFVFLPGVDLDDLFKAVSIFVGYQTLDPNLANKAAVILNSDGSWDPLLNLLDELHQVGTIRQDYRQFLLLEKKAEAILPTLERVRRDGTPPVSRSRREIGDLPVADAPKPASLAATVCVFCSATIKDPSYLEDGYTIGRRLAQEGFGCVSGAGTTGVMGAVVRGSVEAGGWTGGSNVPHIIEIEGLPEGLSTFWLRPDIYTRMEAMMDHSDAFVIFPGGAGTVQELLALIIFKRMGHPLMKGKPILIFNRAVPNRSTGFWDKLISLLRPWHAEALFEVVDRLDQIVPACRTSLEISTGTGQR